MLFHFSNLADSNTRFQLESLLKSNVFIYTFHIYEKIAKKNQKQTIDIANLVSIIYAI